MAKTAFTNSCGVFNDSEFREFCSRVSSAFQAVGMVKTNDTGQINLTTVSRPGAGGDGGYEIWRFNDALQATVPIVFKVVYGIASASSGRITIYVGSGSNGSGTITGQYINGIAFVGNNMGYSAESNWSRLWYMASDGSGLTFIANIDCSTPVFRGLFVIDRTRNIDGTPNDNGVFITGKSGFDGTITTAVQDRKNNLSPPANVSRGFSLMPLTVNSSQSLSINDTVYFMPYTAMTPGGNGVQRIKMLLCYAAVDYGFNSNVSVNHLGSARTYKTLGTNLGYCDSRNQQYATAAVWQED